MKYITLKHNMLFKLEDLFKVGDTSYKINMNIFTFVNKL